MYKILILITFSFVSIVANAITPNRHNVPDFALNPTITSVQSGNWFSPSTWSTGDIPATDDIVKVNVGHTVTYGGVGSANLDVLGIEGVLQFNTSIDSEITVGTILVYPSGRLDVGTATNPIASDKSVEIIIANRPLDFTADPEQWGTGLIGLGEVNFHGAEIPKTWFRVAVEPLAGDNTLTLESDPIGWAVGDEIILPGTKNEPLAYLYQGQTPIPQIVEHEKLYVSNIVGNVITLTAAIQFDHLGWRDTNDVVQYLPHVGNLTRNIVVRSEDPNGVRGHSIFTDRADVKIQYTSFIGMGRTTREALNNTTRDENGVVTNIGTNQIGRYPIHMHHNMGLVNPTNTGYQYVLAGNTIDDGEKWGIAIHGTHFGIVDNNVVFDTTGSGIMAEGGNERQNVFSNNFVVKVGTQVTSWESPRYGGVAGTGRPLGFADFGYEGTGLWFVGNDHIVTGNVVANARYAGYMFNARPFGFTPNRGRYPNHRGADMDDPSQWTVYGRGVWAPPIITMENNEAYALSEFIWISFAGVVTNSTNPIENNVGWNIKQTGLYSQRNQLVHYKNLTILGDLETTQLSDRRRRNVGVNLAAKTYMTGETVFEGLKVHNMDVGIDLPVTVEGNSNRGRLTDFDDVDLQNYVNIIDRSPRRSEKETRFNNLRVELNAGPDKVFSDIPAHILTRFETPWRGRNITWLSTFSVTGWQGIVGNDFELFFDKQRPEYVMPVRMNSAGFIYTEQNCPTLGSTNADCQVLHGISTLDRVATCDPSEEPQIEGVEAIVCPLDAVAEPPDLISSDGFE